MRKEFIRLSVCLGTAILMELYLLWIGEIYEECYLFLGTEPFSWPKTPHILCYLFMHARCCWLS